MDDKTRAVRMALLKRIANDRAEIPTLKRNASKAEREAQRAALEEALIPVTEKVDRGKNHGDV